MEMMNRGIEVKIIGMKNGLDIASAIRFYRFLKKRRFDLIHSHIRNILSGFCLIFGAKDSLKIITEHLLTEDVAFLSIRRFRRIRLFYRFFSKNYHKIIAISQSTQKALIEKTGVSPKQITHIPNGIDTSKYDLPCNPT